LGGKVKSLFFDKGVSLNDCLRRYCAPEYLTGKEQYHCERCKRKNDCEKRILFKELPEILCIHLKRFRFDNAYGWFAGSKNSRVVIFPVTTHLDMSQFMEDPPNQPVEYRLIGLIQHIGSMGGGHYIAYCQHKRKAQDWYEFDDVQVNPVMPEQVERAEPYVLFYQRVPSRAAKHDRQTFKNDMRATQERINQYLMHSASRCRRNLYRSPPAELDMAFVSKHWYVRLTTMSRPGPLDNKEYLGPHGKLGYSSEEFASEAFLPISRSLSKNLISIYGGGPEITSLENCPLCQRHISAYNLRRAKEYELVQAYDTKDTGDGQCWYLVDTGWVEEWKKYVKSEPITAYWDMCGPGPVRNERLFEKDNPTKLKSSLRLKIDYIGVNGCVWWLFMHVHGGGPAVVRNDLEDIAEEMAPETHLVPDEIRPTAGNDLYMRTSWEFVDECHGDEEMYKRLYGSQLKPPETPQGDAESKPDVELKEADGVDSRPCDPEPLEPSAELPTQAAEPPAEPAAELSAEPAEQLAEQSAEPPVDMDGVTLEGEVSEQPEDSPSDAVMHEPCQDPPSSL